MDIMIEIRQDLILKTCLLNYEKEDFGEWIDSDELYKMLITTLCRISQNDNDFVYSIYDKVEKLLNFIKCYRQCRNQEFTQSDLQVIDYLNKAVGENSKTALQKKKQYEYMCISFCCRSALLSEKTLFRRLSQSNFENFETLLLCYYGKDDAKKHELENSSMFLVLANELVRVYGNQLPSTVVEYIKDIVEVVDRDKFSKAMFFRGFKALQRKTLKHLQLIDEKQKKLFKRY